MASLQDQLLNIGVIDKKKAKKSQHQKRQNVNKNRKAIKSGKNVEVDTIQQQLALADREKQQRDLALNKQRDAEQAKKALVAEVRQIVQQHQIKIPKEADLAYNFSFDNTIKKIYVTSEQQQQLTLGQLAIVNVEQKYCLVPDKVAEKIEIRLPESVLRIQVEKQADDHDPYADYQIPDDLMW